MNFSFVQALALLSLLTAFVLIIVVVLSGSKITFLRHARAGVFRILSGTDLVRFAAPAPNRIKFLVSG